MKILQPASMRNLKFSTVTALINCRVRIVAGVDVLASLVHSRQSATGMFWVLRRNIVIRVNVMMIQLERDLKIICHAILELFAKIEGIVDAVLFSQCAVIHCSNSPPASGKQIGGVSPDEDCFVGADNGKTK